MARRNTGPWMWGDTVDLLEQAERLQRQFFRLAGGVARASWEPPVDVFADGEEILVEVALPGVPPDRIELICAPGELVVRGERRLPRRHIVVCGEPKPSGRLAMIALNFRSASTS